MIAPLDPDAAQLASPLGRTSPIAKLAVAMAWLLGLAFMRDPREPLVLAGLALAAGSLLGRIPLRVLLRGLAPLAVAALGVALFNTLLSPAGSDPTVPAIFEMGPFRVTGPSLAAGVALGLRVLAIAAVGVVFAQTTDSTRLVDSLVQQGRLPERFAYGALAAYQAIPRLSDDLTALRQARRLRGLRVGWHPRLLLALLVRAIRHGDHLALAMDARAFGSGPRSRYRTVHWAGLDAVVVGAGLGVLALAFAAG